MQFLLLKESVPKRSPPGGSHDLVSIVVFFESPLGPPDPPLPYNLQHTWGDAWARERDPYPLESPSLSTAEEKNRYIAKHTGRLQQGWRDMAYLLFCKNGNNFQKVGCLNAQLFLQNWIFTCLLVCHKSEMAALLFSNGCHLNKWS